MNELRRTKPWAFVCAIGLLVALANASFWLVGAAPRAVWSALAAGTVGSGYALGQTVAKATPLLFTGASVALALRAGLVNIGAEGQLAVGVLTAAVVGAHMPAGPPMLFVPVIALACALSGAALGGLAGWLRGRFGTHEVISTLMLNGLVAVATTYLYGGPLRVGVQLHTAPLPPSARLPSAASFFPSLQGSTVGATLLLALAVPFFCERFLTRTGPGAHLRALGSNAQATRALGISVPRTTTLAMALSGALAALGGLHYVCGAKGYAEAGMGAGAGFTGLAVAVLGRRRPLGIVLAALLLGALGQGGLAVNALVPADALLVLQSALLVLVAAEALRKPPEPRVTAEAP